MKLKTKLLMPIMGVAAVAGTVIPCAVSCKTEHAADSSNVKVVLVTDSEAGYIWDETNTQVNLETSVAENGELQAKIDWHDMLGTLLYCELVEVTINGKLYVQRTEANPKGFAITSYQRNGFTLSMLDEAIPYDANIKIYITLAPALYDDALKLSGTKDFYYSDDYTTPTTALTSIVDTSSNTYTKANGYVEYESSEYKVVQFEIDVTALVTPENKTHDLEFYFGYHRTSTNGTRFICYENAYRQWDKDEKKFVYYDYFVENPYWGNIALDFTVDHSDRSITVKAPAGGWGSSTEAKTSRLTGWFVCGPSFPKDDVVAMSAWIK